ncbi:relaxase/mobilization nuclease domain-containing protein [Hymenobacter sp. YC55]|uniref:relaxase/mobilization nuclease domain-containing protein n=1 Tax=Hymenobacter sp. YC55 TaxID=3034019 RepID=UPI0023F856A1|nr:relaxase/mobilization nuclease domain-containing protein [Hymenobacter sp. YC55]MDF7813934.1 relaxase/mobilization nuclease domain-containing protein [Hymenobacter sp. YC55]
MIAKTTTGSDFEGALTYGAGKREGKKKEPDQASLLIAINIIPGNPRSMAQQMQATANLSVKIQKPVWHTILSWKAGEAVTFEQKIAAAKRYCELIGAPVKRHQVVVYEHLDKRHAHLHLYLNRVPIDSGPALRTDNNFYRQPAIIRQISQELGMLPLPERRHSIKDLNPAREAARVRLVQALQCILKAEQRGGIDWFTQQLAKERIAVRFTHDRGGVLRGVSFEVNGVALKGREVGYKAAELRQAFTVRSLKSVQALGLELDAGLAATKPSRGGEGVPPLAAGKTKAAKKLGHS